MRVVITIVARKNNTDTYPQLQHWVYYHRRRHYKYHAVDNVTCRLLAQRDFPNGRVGCVWVIILTASRPNRCSRRSRAHGRRVDRIRRRKKTEKITIRRNSTKTSKIRFDARPPRNRVRPFERNSFFSARNASVNRSPDMSTEWQRPCYCSVVASHRPKQGARKPRRTWHGE